MTFQDHARRQAGAALDALINEASAAVREELHALRAAFDERVAALETSVGSQDQRAVLERLVEDLSRAATERAEQAASHARLETQEAADALLAAAQGELDGARASHAAVVASLEQARERIRALQESATTDAAARSNLEERLAREQVARIELDKALKHAQTEIAQSQEEVQARVADLEAVEGRLQAVELECTELRQARDEAEIRADAQASSRATLARDLEEARQIAAAAKAGVDARAMEAHAAAERLRAVEMRLARVEGEGQTAVERVKGGLRMVTGATSAQAILEVLVAQLGQEFPRVALFLNRRNRLEGWRSRGFDSETDIANMTIPLNDPSALARAASDKATVVIEAGAGGVKEGAFGQPVESAIAWPVLVSGGVVAVAYAEHPVGLPSSASLASRQVADVLIEHVGRILVVGRRASAPPNAIGEPGGTSRPNAAPEVVAKLSPASARNPYPGPPRDAGRVRMRSGVDVLIDGTTCQLVDLSTLGAQVLSPKAIRPKQLVRIALPGESGSVPCKGRVVWAFFEKGRSGAGMYRAGVKFTEMDHEALKAFQSQNSSEEDPEASRVLAG